MEETVITTFVLGETDGTSRSEAWLDYVDHTKSNIVLYLAAGRLPFGKGTKLKVRMKEFIQKELFQKGFTFGPRGIFLRDGQSITIVLTLDNAWGTFEECISLLKTIGTKEKQLVVFSSKSHLPRIAKIFTALDPNATLQLIPAKEDMRQDLKDTEGKKEFMTNAFIIIYKLLGEKGLDSVSWVKNLILNVRSAKKEGHYYL